MFHTLIYRGGDSLRSFVLSWGRVRRENWVKSEEISDQYAITFLTEFVPLRWPNYGKMWQNDVMEVAELVECFVY